MSKVALVTGASRGIGRSIALRLAHDGNAVAVNYAHNADAAGSVVDEITNAGGVAVAFGGDVSKAEDVDELFEAVVAKLGTVEVLVNNAGITRDARLINMTDDDFGSVLDVNLGAAFRLSVELAPLLVEGGSIVNISSRAYLGNFGQYNYSMSKGGLVGMTRAMALSLAPHARVNAIAPGLIGTEMAMAIPEDVLEKMISAIPLERMGSPDEIANVVWFLLTPLSSYVTGHVLVVGGGRSLS